RSAALGPGDVLGVGQVLVRPDPAAGADGLPATLSRSWPSAPPAGRFATDRPPGVPEFPAGDPSLALLLNHFAEMQRQQMEQFQQMIMVMLQSFNGMHRDQMGLVREELDRLRELNDEFATIKAQLASPPPRSSTVWTPPPPPPPPPPRPG